LQKKQREDLTRKFSENPETRNVTLFSERFLASDMPAGQAWHRAKFSTSR
jgi:hypothetical protein